MAYNKLLDHPCSVPLVWKFLLSAVITHVPSISMRISMRRSFYVYFYYEENVWVSRREKSNLGLSIYPVWNVPNLAWVLILMFKETVYTIVWPHDLTNKIQDQSKAFIQPPSSKLNLYGNSSKKRDNDKNLRENKEVIKSID